MIGRTTWCQLREPESLQVEDLSMPAGACSRTQAEEERMTAGHVMEEAEEAAVQESPKMVADLG